MKRIAVAGFGFMGLTHTLNILKNKDLNLIAIVDKDTGLIAKNLKEQCGNISIGSSDARLPDGVKFYSEIGECLNSEDIDAVCICVPTPFHYELTRKALQNNKHVFLEKPICLEVSQAEELIDLAEGKNLLLMVGHVVRFMPPYKKLKQWIDSNEFGELRFLSLTRFCGLPGWGQWKDRAVAGSSGGALFDLVIHDIDFAAYAQGSPGVIESSLIAGEMSNHDYVRAMWHYDHKNLKVSIEGGNIFHTNFPFQAGFMAKFEKASVLYTTLKGNVIQIADDQNIKEIPSGDPIAGYSNEIAYFSQCLESGTRPNECMPESSLQSLRLCYNHIKE